MQTIQQQRAAYALEKVKSASATANKKEYKSHASGLPAMIHMNGLGQAAAFYKSRSKDSKGSITTHGELYNVLSEWLTNTANPETNADYLDILKPYANYNDLLEGITDSDMQTYHLAQAEAQALMDWVKKFAKAYMGDD